MKRLILSILFVAGIITTAWSQSKTFNREVIVQLKPGTVVIEGDESEARIQDLLSVAPELRSTLLQFNAEKVAKTFPSFKLSDTLKVNRTGEQVRLADLSNIYTVRLASQAQRKEFIERLTILPFVIYAERNGGVAPNVLPNDEYFDDPSNPGNGGQQWSLLNTGQNFGTNDADIDAPEAWDITKGSSNTKIGIIDSGINSNHVDLNGKVSGDATVGLHGTHVAGIASAKTNNNEGVAGIDWNAQLINQVFGNDQQTSNAIMDAVNGGTQIINNSYIHCESGTCDDPVPQPRYSTTVRLAFANAYKMNVVAAAAMGNDNTSDVYYPAGNGQGIIAVGASNRNDNRWVSGTNSGSNTGSHIDVVAPGRNIWSTVNYGNGYDEFTGTSMASPHIAGIAGLLLSENPNLYNDDIENIIRLSADKVSGMGGQDFTNEYGMGRANAHKALQRLQSPYVLEHKTATGGFDYSTSGAYAATF